MNSLVLKLLLGSLVTFAAVSAAQDPAETPSPTEHHQWLLRFVGKWETQGKATMGPGQPPIECTGTLTCRSVGEYWIVNEMNGEIMDSPMVGVQTIGYDPQKQQFIGTWIDSSNSFMWHYKGSLDEAGTTLTLEADGPSFTEPGKTTQFRDIYRFDSDDKMTTFSKMKDGDGNWVTFMEGTATRK